MRCRRRTINIKIAVYIAQAAKFQRTAVAVDPSMKLSISAGLETMCGLCVHVEKSVTNMNWKPYHSTAITMTIETQLAGVVA
jgi:hypothetical protein